VYQRSKKLPDKISESERSCDVRLDTSDRWDASLQLIDIRSSGLTGHFNGAPLEATVGWRRWHGMIGMSDCQVSPALIKDDIGWLLDSNDAIDSCRSTPDAKKGDPGISFGFLIVDFQESSTNAGNQDCTSPRLKIHNISQHRLITNFIKIYFAKIISTYFYLKFRCRWQWTQRRCGGALQAADPSAVGAVVADRLCPLLPTVLQFKHI
jgi:hypothetical protein